MYILIIGLLAVIIFSVFEYFLHHTYRKKIPLLIHINGTRGKSSVTRLIAAGLREGGKRTIAKTTGSAPRIILENGSEIPIQRPRGPNIREQVKICKFAAKRSAEALVLECMAVMPEYQWVTEHKIVRSDIGVITNIRLDHLVCHGTRYKKCHLFHMQYYTWESTIIYKREKSCSHIWKRSQIKNRPSFTSAIRK